jgi:hypothetical protein
MQILDSVDVAAVRALHERGEADHPGHPVRALTVVSGFFGMNFGWLVRHIDSATAFFVRGTRRDDRPVAIILTALWRAGHLGSRG